VPAVVAGLSLSTFDGDQSKSEGITLGSSLLLTLLTKLTLGHFPDTVNITLHPIAFAGWIGLFVTALNLLPVGQLDGGHIVYALFGARHIWISRLGFLFIFSLGLLRWWDGWLVWSILLLFLGFRHPPCLDSYTPLDLKRKVLGWFMIGVFIFTFTPAPFSFTEPVVELRESVPRSDPAAFQVDVEGRSI
jgi:membrane-associated protease RseP (regulator of RpoE activity)